MWNAFLVFLDEWASELGAAAVLAAALGWLINRFKKKEKTDLSEDSIDKISSNQAKDGPSLSVPEFIRIRRELKADLEKELASAADAEKDQLRARITELEGQIADPEPALKIANERIADLEARLAREGNALGAEKLDAARAALETGDYSVADDLFADIEARNALAVQSAARAAFARGEIAEAEVRWADAAKHYARSVGLDTSLAALRKAGDYAERAGDYPAALDFGERAVELVRDGNDQIELSSVLNDHAITLKAAGRYDEAEPLYRESLQITGSTLGKDHPAYATSLDNLAGLLETTGRYDDAAPLNREAMQITGATLGKDHPAYATHLNNLAGLLETTGRYDEAEPLYREAMQITGATLGKDHPAYATTLNNLATLLETTGRYDDAEPLYREAMQITGATLGKDHPAYATKLNNLAVLYAYMNRVDEALPLMEQALVIWDTALGSDHPDTELFRQSLTAMRAEAGK